MPFTQKSDSETGKLLSVSKSEQECGQQQHVQWVPVSHLASLSIQALASSGWYRSHLTSLRIQALAASSGWYPSHLALLGIQALAASLGWYSIRKTQLGLNQLKVSYNSF